VRIEVNRVEDTEGLLADLVTFSGRAAQHLLVENAAVNAANENKARDAGHVDPRREKVNGDGYLRQGVVSEGADQPADAVNAPCDLANGGVLDLAIASFHGRLDFFDENVRVPVGSGEYQGFPRKTRINVLGQFLGDDAVEFLRDDALLKDSTSNVISSGT
jgi:hypothetical protein